MIKIDEKDPRVIALRKEEKRLHELATRHGEKKAELDKAMAKYIAARQMGQSKLAIEVDEVLRGEDIGPKISRGDIERLEHENAVLSAAIKKQQHAVDVARGQFSLALCESVKARYVEIERRIAKAVQELAAANEAELKFIQELWDSGCSSVPFRPMRVSAIGVASDPQSRAAFHRKEVQEFCPEAAV
jgi:hypothetical protein